MWTTLILLKKPACGGLLWTQQATFGFQKRRGIYTLFCRTAIMFPRALLHGVGYLINYLLRFSKRWLCRIWSPGLHDMYFGKVDRCFGGTYRLHQWFSKILPLSLHDKRKYSQPPCFFIKIEVMVCLTFYSVFVFLHTIIFSRFFTQN
jgi:hypothetical protein